ncbi:MAG TPA: UDP-N-acetylmuramate dehydrogenase [Rhizomicrobium sp.]|jgi:UDP-N-acetylmuramate dehydrogenase|nr:UDP-N-acetylmuramate dehydrogenase [Rhizomicrobium sp.]
MSARFRDALPAVRGSYTESAALKDFVWFRAGGPAEFLFRPADEEDLQIFLARKPRNMPLSVIGVGSNLMVRDGGIRGVVVRLPASFGRITAEGDRVRAGAAALDAAVARAAAEAGIGGLEFLRGIPGTIGGALRMNAGCYGREIKDVFVEAVAIDESGTRIVFDRDDISFAYRSSSAPEGLIFIEAVLQGVPESRDEVRARMEALVARREATQPIRAKTGGSTFKNPPGDRKAWQLIDEAGCRGLSRGDAQVSEKHCNFLINTGEATASDLETLGEEVRACVRARSGVILEWEIKRVGVA